MPSLLAGRRAGTLLALVLLVLGLGAGVAVAGWQSSGGGTTTAKAGAITAPVNLTGTPSCSGTTAVNRIDWDDVTGATGYQIDLATNSSFTSGFQTGSTTASTATVSLQSASSRMTIYVRTRAVAGNWVSGNSSTLTTTLGACR